VEARPTELAAPPMDDATKPLVRMPPEDVQDDDYDPAIEYRALCTPAIASLVLGVLSGLAFLDVWLGLIPFAAILLGLAALRKIRAHPDEYTGRALAVIGLVLAAVLWIGGGTWQYYVFANELPDPSTIRISYAELQPQEGDRPGEVPEDAKALDGKKVLIRGYVYPGTRQSGITQFLLVRDQGSCCFGGNPKITDRIEVSLTDSSGFTFSQGQFKVAGVFHVMPSSQAIDAGGKVFYRLDEAMLR
jgi:hypothetical protein